MAKKIILKSREMLMQYGTAIDAEDTIYREDCYHCEVKSFGIRFRVMVAIPPVSLVNKDGLQSALIEQFETGKAKHLPNYFLRQQKKDYTFSTVYPCESLVTEYILFDHVLTSESAYLAQTTLSDRYSYQVYGKTLRASRHTEIIRDILSGKRHLLRKFNDDFSRDILQKSGIAGQLIYGAMELFNHTCRNVARDNNIPFVAISEKEKGSSFRISHGYAYFNRSFRDPCAYLNLTNLVHFLTTGEPLYSEDELLALLPK